MQKLVIDKNYDIPDCKLNSAELETLKPVLQFGWAI